MVERACGAGLVCVVDLASRRVCDCPLGVRVNGVDTVCCADVVCCADIVSCARTWDVCPSPEHRRDMFVSCRCRVSESRTPSVLCVSRVHTVSLSCRVSVCVCVVRIRGTPCACH